MVDRDCASPRSMDGTASADRIVGEHATQGGYEGGVIVDLNVSRSVILEATPRPSSVRQPRHDGTGGHVQLSGRTGRLPRGCEWHAIDRSYRGIVHGYSPGCFRAHECPVQVDPGSSGGPHHGHRSSHQFSPVSMPMTTMKPVSERNMTTPNVSPA
jgi:hypothetical protein